MTEVNSVTEDFPLWSFKNPGGTKIIATRGRTCYEAARYAFNFLDQKKDIHVRTYVTLLEKIAYDKCHQGYDWLHTKPRWLEEEEKRQNK